MQRFYWGFLGCQLLASLAAASPIASSPTTTTNLSPDLVKRAGAGPSSYPYGTAWVNEMSWENWDPANTADERGEAQQIHDAYVPMKEMVFYAWQEANAKSAIYKRWFPEDQADLVRQVLERMMDMKAQVPEFLPLMKDRVLDREDFRDKCAKRQHLNAYTIPKSGRHHICPHGLEKPNLATLTCEQLDGNGADKYMSNKAKTLSSIMLHEAVHWNQIGEWGMGEPIIDIKPKGKTARECHTLPGDDQVINARNYEYMATEAYLLRKGCHFIDPPAESADVDEDDVDDIFEEDTKAISIIYRSFTTRDWVENDWYVYETPVGVSALCRNESETVAKWDAEDGPNTANLEGPRWPAGTFDINTHGMECQYKNDGTNAGALWCKDQPGPFHCYEDDKLSKHEGEFCDGFYDYQQPYVYCQW